MNLTILREFVTLANNLNYSSTAKQLFISQSVLTKHIQILEKEIGVRLFTRDSHSVRPTQAGRYFADHIKEMLEGYNDIVTATIDIDRQISSTLRIGYPVATAEDTFPAAYGLFVKRHPETKLTIHSMEIDDILQTVCQGTLDLGYTALANSNLPNGIACSVLMQDCFGILVESKHKLAKKESVTFDDIRGYAVLVPNAHAYPSHALATLHLLEDSTYPLDIRDTMNDIGSIRPHLASTGGVAVTMGFTQDYFGDKYRFVPFEHANQKPAVAAIWKQSHENSELLDFVDCLHETMQASSHQMA